jgi:hypothetical protein
MQMHPTGSAHAARRFAQVDSVVRARWARLMALMIIIMSAAAVGNTAIRPSTAG